MMMAVYTWTFMERWSERLCHTLFVSPLKELLALNGRFSSFLLTVASLEMVLPR